MNNKAISVFFSAILLLSLFIAFQLPVEGPGVLPDSAFTVVVIPDTQKYIEHGVPFAHIFTNQTQWIVDNQDLYNI